MSHLKALAVFHEHGCHRFDFLLARRFRHTFVAVQSGNYWITVDGRDGVPRIEVVAGSDYDLATFYRSEGFTVVETETSDTPRTGFILPKNCVGMVKAVIGRGGMAITPHQLYKRLRRG